MDCVLEQVTTADDMLQNIMEDVLQQDDNYSELPELIAKKSEKTVGLLLTLMKTRMTT